MTATRRDLRLLRRPTQGRMLAGVADGVARYLNVDVTASESCSPSSQLSAARGCRSTSQGGYSSLKNAAPHLSQ